MMKYYVSNKLDKDINNIEFENYLLENLYLLTVLVHPINNTDKITCIDDCYDRFKLYVFKLYQDIFNGKATRKKYLQPLAIGFYDQEGTREHKNYKKEMFPHVHALLLPTPQNKINFEKISNNDIKDTYGIPRIREVDIEKYTGDKGIDYVTSYCAKYTSIANNFKRTQSFEVMPDHFKME